MILLLEVITEHLYIGRWFSVTRSWEKHLLRQGVELWIGRQIIDLSQALLPP